MDRLFICDDYRHVLFHLLMVVEPPVFGLIGRLNRYCRDMVAAATDDKQQQWLEPVQSNDPAMLWVNWRFIHNGLYHGEYKYWSDGELRVSCAYRGGRLHGGYIEYCVHPDGIFARNYCNGVMHGTQTEVRLSKKIVTEYVHGVKHGPCTATFINTKGAKERPAYRLEFKNGKLEGEYTVWHISGAVKVKTTYVDGRIHGPYKLFYPNGDKCLSCTFVHGRIDGILSCWYNGDRLKRRILYDKGEPIVLEQWNERGAQILKMMGPFNGAAWLEQTMPAPAHKS